MKALIIARDRCRRRRMTNDEPVPADRRVWSSRRWTAGSERDRTTPTKSCYYSLRSLIVDKPTLVAVTLYTRHMYASLYHTANPQFPQQQQQPVLNASIATQRISIRRHDRYIFLECMLLQCRVCSLFQLKTLVLRRRAVHTHIYLLAYLLTTHYTQAINCDTSQSAKTSITSWPKHTPG